MNIQLNTAIQFLQDRNYPIPSKVIRFYGLKKAMKQAIGYEPIRGELWASVYDAVYDFLNSNSRIDTYKSPLASAISKAYIEAGDIAYADGGGSLPMDEDTLSLAKTLLNEQLAYVDSLFERLKQLRKEGDFDAISQAFQRADGYANSLDSFYNSIKVAGAGNKMLTFTGSDGKESCSDCKRLKGQRHRASWWKSHGLVPPSREFECRGYNCEHRLVDDNGDVFTI